MIDLQRVGLCAVAVKHSICTKTSIHEIKIQRKTKRFCIAFATTNTCRLIVGGGEGQKVGGWGGGDKASRQLSIIF